MQSPSILLHDYLKAITIVTMLFTQSALRDEGAPETGGTCVHEQYNYMSYYMY